MFALVDCNNFFASCERVFRPDLVDKPIVVLSNNDGCVIARSNEAKKLGIPMGAPAFKFAQNFKENGITVFSSNYPLYGDMSNRVMTLLSGYAPELEIYSIDEAFLKFQGTFNFDFLEYATTIQKTVTKSTGIPISIGFAPTKALAKVANRIAKKYPNRTNNVYVIDSEEKRIKALKWLKIEDVWGIGNKHAERLKKYGVYNAYEFTKLNESWVRKHLSILGIRLQEDLKGKPTLDLEPKQAKKSIATTRTFERTYSDYKLIRERISTFAISCAEKLRRQKTHCNALMVFIRTNTHKKEQAQYYKSVVIPLPYPTNSSIELSKFAISGLKQIFKEGYQYKKAGVVVMGITPENKLQLSLFENSNPRHKSLMKVVDKVNQSFGMQKIKFGSQDLKRTWKMKQENLSPRYTTNLNEILKVNSY